MIRIFIGKLIWFTFLLALVLGVFEIGLRIYYAMFDPLAGSGYSYNAHHAYGFVGEPNAQGRHKTDEFDVTIAIGKQGFRGDQNIAGADIALLGDDNSWGVGVDETQRFSSFLEQKTGKNIADLSLPFTGTINQLAVYRDFVANSGVKTVILQFHPNDLMDNAKWIPALKERGGITMVNLLAEMKARKELGYAWLHEGAQAHPVAQFIAGSALKRFAMHLYEQIIMGMGKDSSVTVNGQDYRIGNAHYHAVSYYSGALIPDSLARKEAWEVTALALSQIKQETAARGQKLIIVYFPYQEAIHSGHWPKRQRHFGIDIPKEALDFDLPISKLRLFAHATDVPVIDVTDEILTTARRISTVPMYYVLDGHLTTTGNSLAADAVAAYLK